MLRHQLLKVQQYIGRSARTFATGGANKPLVGAAIDAVALRDGSRSVLSAPLTKSEWTAEKFQEEIDALARGFIEIGYTAGKPLAAWMSNETEFLVLLFAAAKAGIRLVTIDPSVSLEHITSILKEEDCRGLIFTERYQNDIRTPRIKEVLPEITNGPWNEWLNSKSLRQLKHIITAGTEEEHGVMHYHEIPWYGPVKPDPLAIRLPEVTAKSTVMVPYTSGSDGKPSKTKEWNHDDLLSLADKSISSMKLSQEDTLTSNLPLFSATGMAYGPLAAALTGARFLLPAKEFKAQRTLKYMQTRASSKLLATSNQVEELKALAKGEQANIQVGVVDSNSNISVTTLQ